MPPQRLVESSPEWILIAPCGLDLPTTRKEARADMANQSWWPSLPAVQRNQVFLVDGNQHFNRPGPRLVDALEFLVGLLWGRPDLVPWDFPYERFTT